MKNKAINFIVMTALILSVLGMVSAESLDKTLIAGKIYNADYTATIEGATVTVTCGGNPITTTSLNDGAYNVSYMGVCDAGDVLNITAVYGSLYGTKQATLVPSPTCTSTDNCLINVYEDENVNVDFAVVNVPLVPEFGAIVASLTVLGALGVFFVVRRK